MSYATIEHQLTALLRLRRRPVAVAYRDAPPPGVERLGEAQPSGCSFWRLAGDGRTFYTRPADHYNCAVGSYTHNIPLPADRAHELQQTLELMTGAGYLKMEEVEHMPRLRRTPGVVIYAPLGDTPVDPDVVLFTGLPGRVMLLQEAATRAGVASRLPLLGGPPAWRCPRRSPRARRPARAASETASTRACRMTSCTS